MVVRVIADEFASLKKIIHTSYTELMYQNKEFFYLAAKELIIRLGNGNKCICICFSSECAFFYEYFHMNCDHSSKHSLLSNLKRPIHLFAERDRSHRCNSSITILFVFTFFAGKCSFMESIVDLYFGFLLINKSFFPVVLFIE